MFLIDNITFIVAYLLLINQAIHAVGGGQGGKNKYAIFSLPSEAGASSTASYIAITFDDGPHQILTPKLLDIFKEKKSKATFFVMVSSSHSQSPF